MTRILISIGSNQNHPLQQVQQALSTMSTIFQDLSCSHLYETQPVGSVEQAAFINAALSCETDLTADAVMNTLKGLERDAGRNRDRETPKGPRNLDLDLILFGSEICSSSQLDLPHPRFRQRRFVLEPAAEVAADLMDPVSHHTIRELLEQCTDPSWVQVLAVEAAEA